MATPDAALAGFRYERKFLVPVESWSNVHACIRLNPGRFSGLYQPRTVNNIYLDAAGLPLYFMNLEGAADRTKVRIRWYGQLFGTHSRPVLEFKIKRGLLGKKASFPLQPFTFDSKFAVHTLRQALSDSELPSEVRHQLAHLEPTLVNRYHRAYFQSADTRYRITLDADLEFLRVRSAHNLFLCQAPRFPYRVLELKFDSNCWEDALAIANALPYRVSRISKYVCGLDSLDGC